MIPAAMWPPPDGTTCATAARWVLLESLGDPKVHLSKRRDQGGAVRTAALRQVGPPAALAADLPGNVAEHVAGLDAAGGGASDTGHQCGLAAAGPSKHHHRV